MLHAKAIAHNVYTSWDAWSSPAGAQLGCKLRKARLTVQAAAAILHVPMLMTIGDHQAYSLSVCPTLLAHTKSVQALDLFTRLIGHNFASPMRLCTTCAELLTYEITCETFM